MHLIQKNNIKWIVKLPVLVLYVLFFTVQIFFNFDTGSRSLIIGENSFHTGFFKSLTKENVKQGEVKTPAKTKIRLNKRFQPSSVPGVPVFKTEILPNFGEPAQTILCTANLHASVFHYTHSLRGPPVVA